MIPMPGHIKSDVLAKKQLSTLLHVAQVLESQGIRNGSTLLLCISRMSPGKSPLEGAPIDAPFAQLPPFLKNSLVRLLSTYVRS